MKQKQNANENVTKIEKSKRQKKNNVFVVYADGKGFLMQNNNDMPSFGCEGEIVKLTSKREALLTVNLVKMFNLADENEISVFSKIA